MTTTTVLAIIVPVEVLLIALFAGIPLWLVIKHPDQRPRPALAVPRQRRAHAAAARAASQPWEVDRLRLTNR